MSDSFKKSIAEKKKRDEEKERFEFNKRHSEHLASMQKLREQEEDNREISKIVIFTNAIVADPCSWKKICKIYMHAPIAPSPEYEKGFLEMKKLFSKQKDFTIEILEKIGEELNTSVHRETSYFGYSLLCELWRFGYIDDPPFKRNKE